MENKKKYWPVRVIAFILLVLLLLGMLSKLLVYPYDSRPYGWTEGLYREPAGSLDAIFIGSSNTNAFWSVPFAWEEFGLATYNYGVSSQKMEAFRYMIEEARKTQPDALYVISLVNTDLPISVEHVHFLTDYMHPSQNRRDLIMTYAKYAVFDTDDSSSEDSTENSSGEEGVSDAAKTGIKDSRSHLAALLFPLLLYHTRWDELRSEDFRKGPIIAKETLRVFSFLNRSANITEKVRTVTERMELEAEEEEVLLDLLNYLEENHVRALFLSPPQYRFTDEELAETNTALDLVEAHGFPVLNIREVFDETGLDPVRDFYDAKHTNIHGALKYTRYIARYLLENYGFPDRRNDPAYSSFDTAYEEYLEVVSPYLLDIEIEDAPRSMSFSARGTPSLTWEEDRIVLSWDATPKADGYRIYRRTEELTEVDAELLRYMTSERPSTPVSAWECVADLDGGQLEFSDPVPEGDAVYRYTIVPYMRDGDTVVYGRFSYKGVQIVVNGNG